MTVLLNLVGQTFTARAQPYVQQAAMPAGARGVRVEVRGANWPARNLATLTVRAPDGRVLVQEVLGYSKNGFGGAAFTLWREAGVADGQYEVELQVAETFTCDVTVESLA